MGTQCSSKVIIPHKTQTYNDIRQSETKEIPQCTLKNFPFLLEHSIEFAIDFFDGIFTKGPM